MIRLGLGLGLSAAAGGGPSVDLIMIGDSITVGYTGAGYFTAATADLIATRQAMTVNLTRIGESGSSWDYDYLSDGHTINWYIENQAVPVVSADSKIVLFAGTNGLKLGGKTPAQEYSDFETGLGLLLAAGATAANIVVCTMLPREAYSEANRASYNALLVGGAVTYGYTVAKFHLNTDIGLDQRQNDTYWFADTIHPTTNACDQMARIVYDKIYTDFYDSFTPDQIPNYYNHWDAQDSGSITQSGSRVSAWAAQGASLPLTQATGGNQPLYNATGINSLPAIEFDGASRRAWLENASINLATKPSCSWVVFESDDYTTTEGLIWYLGTDNTTWESGVRLRTITNGRIEIADALNGQSRYYAAAASLDPMAITTGIAWTGGPSSGAGIWKNGLEGGVSAPSATALTATALRVGSPTLNFWNLRGKIGEIGFIAGSLPAYWHQLLAKKLAAKWGLAAPDVP